MTSGAGGPGRTGRWTGGWSEYVGDGRFIDVRLRVPAGWGHEWDWSDGELRLTWAPGEVDPEPGYVRLDPRLVLGQQEAGSELPVTRLAEDPLASMVDPSLLFADGGPEVLSVAPAVVAGLPAERLELRTAVVPRAVFEERMSPPRRPSDGSPVSIEELIAHWLRPSDGPLVVPQYWIALRWSRGPRAYLLSVRGPEEAMAALAPVLDEAAGSLDFVAAPTPLPSWEERVPAALVAPRQRARVAAAQRREQDELRSWLRRRITPEAAAAEMEPAWRRRPPDFGVPDPAWTDFLAALGPGDELWTFSSSEGSWRALAGRAGYAIVRDGEVVKTYVTCMS